MKLGSIEEIEDVTSNKKNKKIDTTKLGVTNLAKYIGIQSENINSDYSIIKINSLISYSEPQKPSKFRYTGIRDIPSVNISSRNNRARGNSPEVSFIREGAVPDISDMDFVDIRPGNVDERLRNPNVELTIDFLNNRSEDQLENRLDMLQSSEADILNRLFLTNTDREIRLLRIVRERQTITNILNSRRARLSNESQFENAFNVNIWGTSGATITVSNPVEVKEDKKILTFDEKKIENFDSFFYNYGGKPALVKGYIIKDKILINNEDLLTYVKEVNPSSSQIKIIIRYFYLDTETKEVKSKLINLDYSKSLHLVKNANYIIPYILKLKVKECTLSNEVFSDSNYRSSFTNSLKSEYIDEWTIENSTPKKIGSSTQCIIIVDKTKDKKLKFLPQDCTFINDELKGYIVPIDKTITSRSIVRINPKHAYKYCLDNCEEDAKVISIKTNKSSKKISSNCRNHRMDVITIKTINTNRILLVYAQDLKLIKTITKNEQQPKPSISEEKLKKTISSFFEEATAANRNWEPQFTWHPIR